MVFSAVLYWESFIGCGKIYKMSFLTVSGYGIMFAKAMSSAKMEDGKIQGGKVAACRQL